MTLCFLTSPDKSKCEGLDIFCLHWLDLENLEMELLEFQEISTWKRKSYDMHATPEKIRVWGEEMTVDSTSDSYEYEILIVWNSLGNKFKSTKSLWMLFLLCLDHLMLVNSYFHL